MEKVMHFCASLLLLSLFLHLAFTRKEVKNSRPIFGEFLVLVQSFRYDQLASCFEGGVSGEECP